MLYEVITGADAEERHARRQPGAPHEGDYQFHDAAGAQFSRHYQGIAPPPHRGRIRHPGAGCQSPPETAPANAEDDEKDEKGRHGENAAQP